MKRSIKDAAKKGQKDVCIILAKEMIHSKKAVSKLYASKAQMNSVLLSMKNQLCESGFRLTYAMQSSITTPSHFIDRIFFLCVCVCPDSCVKNGWCIAEEHRGHEGHAEPGKNPRDPGYYEGTLEGDDEGLETHQKFNYFKKNKQTKNPITAQTND